MSPRPRPVIVVLGLADGVDDPFHLPRAETDRPVKPRLSTTLMKNPAVFDPRSPSNCPRAL